MPNARRGAPESSAGGKSFRKKTSRHDVIARGARGLGAGVQRPFVRVDGCDIEDEEVRPDFGWAPGWHPAEIRSRRFLTEACAASRGLAIAVPVPAPGSYFLFDLSSIILIY